MANTYTKPEKQLICLDANVLLEALFDRKNSATAKKVLLDYSDRLSISTLTVHLTMYFGLRELPASTVRLLLDRFEILSLEPEDVAWAYDNMSKSDYEDALQVSVALRSRCEVFYTLDRGIYDAYKGLSQIQVKLLR